MDDFSTRSAIVVDNGLFGELAIRLAKDFGRVYYYTPWESPFPKTNARIVGAGFEDIGVERVNAWAPFVRKADLWVFPDVTQGPLQEHLASIGERVWGSRTAEDLENDRPYQKQVLASVGLPVGPYEEIVGIANLRAYLKESSGVKYIKVSCTRGDVESFRSESYELSEPKLDELEHHLGPLKTSMPFIVEDEIPDAVEMAYDGFCIDGQYPESTMYGIETKGKAYIGRFRKNEDLPDPIKIVNEALAPVLRKYQYRNFWSAEMRVVEDGTPYVIDPCCRCGSPPSEVAHLMYANLSEIIWEGAAGTLVTPVPEAEWAAEIMVGSEWAADNWQAVQFPERLRDNVKLYFPAKIDDRYYTAPQHHKVAQMGAVVAVGATMEEAITNCKTIAEEVKGYYLSPSTEGLDAAQEAIDKLKSFGYDF